MIVGSEPLSALALVFSNWTSEILALISTLDGIMRLKKIK